MHGGTVEAHSASLGKGSEFVVRLPLQRDDRSCTGGAESSAGSGVLSGKRLLVVDDNRDAADSLSLLLQADGADVRVAYNGPEALAADRDFCTHAVLLDLGMPGMDGYEVARRLREHRGQLATRIIALTGLGAGFGSPADAGLRLRPAHDKAGGHRVAEGLAGRYLKGRRSECKLAHEPIARTSRTNGFDSDRGDLVRKRCLPC